jgi:murein L,D-transpeptidase YcbB/YkuD
MQAWFCGHARFVVLVIAAAVALIAPAPAAEPADPLSWFDDGRPIAPAPKAVALLAGSAEHGLQPADYNADGLQRALRRAQLESPVDATTRARIDRALTAAFLRYLDDLEQGRIPSEGAPYRAVLPGPASLDRAADLAAAVRSDRLDELVRRTEPRFPQYQALRSALAHYRTLDPRPWSTPLPPLPQPPQGLRGERPRVDPGQSYAGLDQLRARLVVLGDLDAHAAAGASYDRATVEAVRSFQARHGLADDGVIGAATLAQLQVPPAARVRQLELMLERLRWTPLLLAPRMVVVNIPEFVLRAYEVQGDRVVVRTTMKVIVGKALDTRTPLIVEPMRSIEFQPFWNVPPSIARAELVPRLRRDPGYWQKEGFEFVTAGGAVVEALSPALLDATLAGAARIRQRPGPRNALGDIKFVFPNREHVFLHHTPSVGLFERDRRDFSHGCIRVEQPVALAGFVLQGMPGWDETRIRAAMTTGEPTTVRLAEPVPVLIAYGTAIVRAGRVHFFADLYGHDRRLDALLRTPRPPLPALPLTP